jgi:flagellar motor switch/type III secretory pathway protein FliN
MAAMNRSEMGAGGANPGANLNLDDDSLFAELDSEVMMGEEQPGGGDLDFDLGLGGEGAPADDLDLDLGGESLPGGGGADDLDLDLGGDLAASAGGDDLDLDLGGGSGGAGMDDMDLDLGDAASGAEEAAPAMAADDGMGDLDLDMDGGASADMDLDLGGADSAPGGADMDLDMGGPVSATEEPDLDLDLDLDESPSAAMADAQSPEAAASEMGGMDLELEPMGGESSARASGGDEMESMELSLDEPVLEMAPALDALADDSDLGLDSLSIEPMDMPDEPVFEMSAAAAGKAATEFHAAEDVPLDEEAVHLELQDIDMEPIGTEPMEDDGFPAGDMIALEPAMRADNSLDLGPMPRTAAMPPEPAQEFVAVPEASFADEDLLELNLDDLDAVPAAEEAPMMQTQFAAAPRSATTLDDTISLTEQLEIPPESAGMARPRMEPMPDFDEMDAMGAAPMASPMMSAAASAMAAPKALPAMRSASQPAVATLAPAQMTGSLLGNDILMAVSHQISVQLGSLSLNGKELMDISYGSVLPLERVIGEPVDLVLENKTIAQAEVVLINGKNLGVRIVALNR